MAEEEAELASFIKDDGISWTDIEDKFCSQGGKECSKKILG